MANYPDKVYLNGKIIKAELAKISVFDRGFLFGDSIYELMLQINGNFFFGMQHLDRLNSCLRKINIDFQVETLPAIIDNLVDVCNLKGKDCLLYIQITRGVAPRKHAFPTQIEPTIIMYVMPFVLPEINKRSISVITAKDFRWHRCDIKMTSLLANVMANDMAIKDGHYETVFYRDGQVTEASHSNIFFVKDDIVFTHPANQNILNGITRELVIQLCKDHNLKIYEEAVLLKNIYKMDEAFLTGTSTQIASIKQIDEHFYYEGNEIGPMTRKLQSLFLNLKNTFNHAKN